MSKPLERIIAGCMTGTSLDGLDVALVKITGTGLEMRAELLGHHAVSLPEDLRAALMSLASGEAREPIVYMRAARALGELHAGGIEQLLAGGGHPPGAKLDFVTAHGQTIWHAPRDSRKDDLSQPEPKSWQLFDPWPIVRRLKVPVCYDLRQADLVAGGEGAPLTPIADWVMYRDRAELVFNLGGICNATYFSGESPRDIRGFDLVPCNLLLNGLAERLLGKPYDTDGQCALAGKPSRAVVNAIKKDAMPHGQGVQSLGRESFRADWLDRVLESQPNANAGEVLASAVEVVCEMIGLFVMGLEEVDLQMVFAGGGVRNKALMQGLRTQLKVMGEVLISDDMGIPCEAREAMAWAVLGALSQDGVPVSLPQVTGSTNPGVAGVWAGL